MIMLSHNYNVYTEGATFFGDSIRHDHQHTIALYLVFAQKVWSYKRAVNQSQSRKCKKYGPINVQWTNHSPGNASTANAMAGKMSRHVTHVGTILFARTSGGIRVHICMACHMTAGAVLIISLATSSELISLLNHAAIAGCECWLR